jgi:hypothetical protein
LKKFTAQAFTSLLLLALSLPAPAQKAPLEKTPRRCLTMEKLEEAIQNNPALLDQWKQEGERQYQDYLLRQQQGIANARMTAGEIIVPVVFHFVDDATHQGWITDRDFYEQVEILNRDYAGKKFDQYLNVLPQSIISRIGRVGVRFTLARRTPSGALTSGIERKAVATPSRINIKSVAGGGLDAWDSSKYLNVWVGTFSGNDAGLLGISTFPFTTSEGPQGVVIGTATLPYTSPTSRSYYPSYAEGATLSHEIGHYFYLYHTFGDQYACNNADFRLQAGWPLPNGTGPEGDDTPDEGVAPYGIDVHYGNPSMGYTMGCVPVPIMYGDFMNYYDDRALFMFSNGQRKRIEACINLYRSGLLSTDGATPPLAVTDAYLVNVTSRGTIERRAFVTDNTPLKAIVRNNGTTALTSVTVNTSIDGNAPVSTTFPLNLSAGSDTALLLSPITGTDGNHTYTVYLTSPNGGSDTFLNNDTLQSFVNINTGQAVTAPFSEDFSGPFPGIWRVWNPNGNAAYTWTKSATSGFAASGCATVQNYNYPAYGHLDDLISPPIDLGTKDSSVLTFRLAYNVLHDPSINVDSTDPSGWDGLEIYVSGDGGANYNLAYKKTGRDLQTYFPSSSSSFAATPSQQDRWRLESVNLTPYIIPGQKLLFKFRNTTAYGNNTYIDDIGISAVNKPTVDMAAVSINGINDFGCTSGMTISFTVKNNAVNPVTSYKINYAIDNGNVTTIAVTNTNVVPYQLVTIPLGSFNFTPGNHTIVAYVSDPNGAVDLNTANDTLHKLFVIFPQVSAPLTQSFEGTFPPSGWAVNNPDGDTTWAKTGLGVRKIAASDSASVFMQNYRYSASNAVDELYSPIVSYTGVDSVFLKFDLAASTYNYPGSTALPEDTLEILITRDCGASFQTVYKKWGADLQTTNGINEPNPSEFIPGSFLPLWRRDSVNLLPFVGTSSSFQLVFRSTHNQPGNNIYIDNINLFTRNVPDVLKQQGYLVLPTVFQNQFAVWHYEVPTTLRYINVYNAVGQLVWRKEYSGNAEKFMVVDLSGKAAGTYFITLGYEDRNRNISQRVVKY